jgi:uncharacterized membrane-anchored protein
MSKRVLEEIIQKAIREGLVPPSASSTMDRVHPWPVLVLTAFGAWLSAIPLVGFFTLLFGRVLEHGPAGYILGPALLAGSVAMFRNRQLPLFIEQLSLPAFLAGLALLGQALSRDLHFSGTTGVLALVVAVVAWASPRNWVRFLLGATFAALLSLAIYSVETAALSRDARGLLSWYVIAGVWLAAIRVQRAFFTKDDAGTVAALEAFSGGIAIAMLCGVAFDSGNAFIASGAFDQRNAVGFGASMYGRAGGLPYLSVLLSLLAATQAALRWERLRRPWYGLVIASLLALAWFVPWLGAVLLVLAFSATSGRWGLVSLAALSALWVIGAFYYQLHFPLTTKAVVLAGIGTLLGAVARFAMPSTEPGSATAAGAPAMGRQALPGIVIAGIIVLFAVNAAIWQKETLISNGKPLFVELAPVDPRSLMQGDFMQLNFSLPEVDTTLASNRYRTTFHVVLRPDERGIAKAVRLDDGSPTRPGEVRIELVPKNHRLVLVTDAWFFEEGQAERWRRAKYGEFRVDGNGRALLVGLRGAQLEKL